MKRRVREEDEIGELNIVPYLDIVTNLLMFMLLSMVGLMTFGILDVGTPKLGEPDPSSVADTTPQQKVEELNLTVAVTDRGFFIAGTGGVLSGTTKEGGGVEVGGEPTVPKVNGQYDYANLSTRVGEIKKSFPSEQRVILVAEMDIPYDTIVQTMDACREQTIHKGEKTERTPLFSQVWLSMMQ